MAKAATKTNEPAPTTVAAQNPVTQTLGGYSVGIFAFIPVASDDLRKQAEIPMLLLDIQEGRKTIADLVPYLKQIEFRQQHVRKRFTVDEVKDLLESPKKADEDRSGDEGDGEEVGITEPDDGNVEEYGE